MKVTLKSVIERANKTHNNFYGYSKSTYTKMKDKTIINCPLHGDFIQNFDSHLRGCGCPICRWDKVQAAKIRPLESVIEQSVRVHNNFYDYSKITTYKNTQDTCKITYPIHGDFEQKMEYHLSGRGCTKCGDERIRVKNTLTQERALEKCKESHGEKFQYPNFNYISDKNKIEIICSTHGSFWQIPLNHFRGVGCPACVGVDSKAELEIRDFISDRIEIVHSDRAVMGNKKEVDIFIPSKKLAIEYDGLYYHSDKFQEASYHLDKTEACLKNNIKLVHIFEDEWLHKEDIVKSRLLNLIGKSEIKLYARNCKIKEVSSKDTTQFLNENHLQGTVGAKIRLGLYYNKELVSLMTFGELRKNLGSDKKEGVFELLRFCNKLNTNIVGGASKLLKHFKKNYEFEEVISYADRRWSTGDLYETLNFDLVSTSRPNYFYTKGTIRENRFKFRKDILVKEGFDKNKTEKEIMKERGYHRIYDCGTLKYSLKQNN